MASNPNPEPALHDAPDGGTPVINYVGPAALAPLPNAAPIPATQPATGSVDRALTWAKRIHFGFLGAFLGLLLYSNGIYNFWPSLVFGVPLILVLWLVGMGVVQERSRYAEWGFIAVVSTFMLSTAMDNGLWRYLNYVNTKDYIFNLGFTLSFVDANEGLFFLAVALGFTLLAGFAVVKSLRRWQAITGLMLIIVTIAGGLMTKYHYGTGNGPSEYSTVDTITGWGQTLSVLAPVLLIALYILSRRQQRNDPAADGKPQG